MSLTLCSVVAQRKTHDTERGEAHHAAAGPR
ncbi:hypothetical protein SGPA1_11320 [Streptomyces misionensis JCM 4497]